MKKLTNTQISNVGQQMAGLWGGSMISWEFEEGYYEYLCIEHGETFIVRLTEEEVRSYL